MRRPLDAFNFLRGIYTIIDPLGVCHMHTAIDEYDGEIEELLENLRGIISQEECKELVKQVYTKWNGESCTDNRVEEKLNTIAKEVYSRLVYPHQKKD